MDLKLLYESNILDYDFVVGKFFENQIILVSVSEEGYISLHKIDIPSNKHVVKDLDIGRFCSVGGDISVRKILVKDLDIYKFCVDDLDDKIHLSDDLSKLILLADSGIILVNTIDFKVDILFEEIKFFLVYRDATKDIILVNSLNNYSKDYNLYIFDFDNKTIIPKIKNRYSIEYFDQEKNKLITSSSLIYLDNINNESFYYTKNAILRKTRDSEIIKYKFPYEGMHSEDSFGEITIKGDFISALTWLGLPNNLRMSFYEIPTDAIELITWNINTQNISSIIIFEEFDLFVKYQEDSMTTTNINYSIKGNYIVTNFMRSIAIYDMKLSKRVFFKDLVRPTFFEPETNKICFYDQHEKKYKIFELIED